MKKLLLIALLTTSSMNATLFFDTARNIMVSSARQINPQVYEAMINHCQYLKNMCLSKESSDAAYKMLVQIYLNVQGTEQAKTLLKDLEATGFDISKFLK